MFLKKNFGLFAANLKSENCIESAELYSQTFMLKIKKASERHSELLAENGFCLIFSKPSLHCKVEPGSVTFILKGTELDTLHLPGFVLESQDLQNAYSAYLDEYKNRIWIFNQ